MATYINTANQVRTFDSDEPMSAEEAREEISRLRGKAETGEEWAHLCWLEEVALGQVVVVSK